MGDPIETQTFPENVNINWTVGNTDYTQSVSLTNIPNYSRDNIFDVAFGVKLKLKESLLVLGNVFVPLNDDGLRAGVVPTLGIEFSF